MWLRWFLVAVLLVLPAAASAAEALGLRVLGFSQDGRYFGFLQYGGVGDGGEFIAEAYVIDVTRDRFAPGTPLLIESWKEPPIDEERPYDKWVPSFALKRFANELRKYGLRPSGWPIAADEGAQTGQTFGLSGDRVLSLGSNSLDFLHDKLGRVRVTLQEKRMPWPRTSRANTQPDAISCAEEVDWQDGVAFRLTLQRGGKAAVLNDDKTIPASRTCVLGYGISEIHTYQRPDGKVSLAVMLGMAVRGFEGNDRRFIAVTAVLAP